MSEQPRSGHEAPAPRAQAGNEEAMLDASLGQLDERLLVSLRADEARRRQRRRLLIGGTLMLTAITAVVVTVLLVANPGSASKPAVSRDDRSKAGALASEGWELWRKRDLTSAQEKFEAAVKLDPGSANHWNGLGWATYQGGDAEGGEKAFEKAIALEPEHPAARNGLGYLKFDARDYKAAEKNWLVAVKNPEATAPYYGMAKMYLLTGEYEKAAEYTAKAQKLDPTDKTLRRMADAARAKRLSPELRKLIEPAAPNAAWGKQSPETARGWQHFSRGEYDEAKELFEAALQKNPNEMPAHNGLGFVLLNTGKPAEARPHFERCLKVDPNAGGPLNGLARCYKAMGDVDRAIEIWEKLVELAPGVNAGTYGLAQAYFEKGQYDKAVPLYEQLAKADEKNPELKEQLAKARQALAEKNKPE
jgi:tetratricopeptide (TPR) repeat protein